MTLNKQLINLLGILLAVVILVAGFALVAYPLYSQAMTLDRDTSKVAQTNSVYRAQVEALSTAEGRIDEIDASLADLRSQIAATPQLDDVYEIVDAAARRADVRVESITADSEEPWIARTQVDEQGKVVAPTTPAPSADAMEGTAGEEAGADATTSTATEPPPAQPAESPQRQLLITVTIDVAQPYAIADDDASVEVGADETEGEVDSDPSGARAAASALAQKAANLVDDLGAGPRLLAPINVAYSDGKLTLSVLTFVRTEN